MLVPEASGSNPKSGCKRIELTNHYAANDTNESGNNALDSQMKRDCR
jgi:hypothetical protein